MPWNVYKTTALNRNPKCSTLLISVLPFSQSIFQFFSSDFQVAAFQATCKPKFSMHLFPTPKLHVWPISNLNFPIIASR